MSKKIYLAVVVLFFIAILSGCSLFGGKDIFDNELIKFSGFDTAEGVTEDFEVVTEVGNVEISWSSTQPNVIFVSGNTAYVTRGDEGVELDLIASYTSRGEVKTKRFTVYVLKKGETGNGGNMPSNLINIYAINDFHGAIFEDGDELGISKMGAFLKSEKTKNPENTIILSAGDMFQGTALSSLTRGKVVVDLMNYIGFDAMALGNHEFDWGVSEIIRYVDGDTTNGEADFPFLGANIFHKPTNKNVDWALPYTVLERNGLKIGVIGLIGESLTSSILGSISKDYIFTSQITAIKKYTKILRTEEKADIVIVVSHDDTDIINQQIKDLTGDEYVDAVLNGHTHSDYVYIETRGTKPPLAIIQSGNNGKYIGRITLEVNMETKKVVDSYAGFVEKSKIQATSVEIDNIVNTYQEYIDIANEELGYAGEFINRATGAVWAANVIREFNNSDVGIVNYGGIRAAGFSIYKDDLVTYGSIFKIMPFENQVITLEFTGSQLKGIMANPGDNRFSSNLSVINQTINNEPIEENKKYKISVIDYVFYRDEYKYILGTNIVYHDVIFRELLVADVKRSVLENGNWRI